MSKKSVPSTPTRSSKRASSATKVSIYQAERDTPKSNGNQRTPMRSAANFKLIVSHEVYDDHYVQYLVELNNGTKISATDFDFKKHPKILADYKKKVTNQTDNSNGEYTVEKVLTHRMADGKPLYLVQWKGYPNPVWHSELWEDDLSNCKNLLTAYKDQSKLSVHAQLSKPTPTKLASRSTKKRVFTSSDDGEEDEQVELTNTTPKKSAKKLNIGSARRPRTSSQQLIALEKREDDDEGKEETVERVEEVQEDSDDDEKVEEKEENAPTTSSVQKSGYGWTFPAWRWF